MHWRLGFFKPDFFKKDKRWVTTISSFAAFFLISAFAAPRVGDLISLRGSFSGRSSADFTQGQNIKFYLATGTQGRILQIRRFKSGNFGLYVALLNGKYESRRAWVHFNPRLNLISLCDSRSASGRCSPTRSIARAGGMRVEKPVVAESGLGTNAAVIAQSRLVKNVAPTVARRPVRAASDSVSDSIVKADEALAAAINGTSAGNGNPCAGSVAGKIVQVSGEGSCVQPLENRVKPYFGGTSSAVTPRVKQAFLGYIAPIAVAVQRETGYPASILIAQAILETGWGRSARFTHGNALFGYSCWKPGKVQSFTVSLSGKEHTVWGSCNSRRPEGGYYYSFDNPIDSVYAYAAGISQPKNAMWSNIRQTMVRAYHSNQGYQLASAGVAIVDYRTVLPMLRTYAVDGHYLRDLQTLIKTYHLDLYDRRTLCV